MPLSSDMSFREGWLTGLKAELLEDCEVGPTANEDVIVERVEGRCDKEAVEDATEDRCEGAVEVAIEARRDDGPTLSMVGAVSSMEPCEALSESSDGRRDESGEFVTGATLM